MANQSTLQAVKIPTHNRAHLTAPTFIPRYRVCLVPDSRHASSLILVHNSTDGTDALRPFFAGLDREQFLITCLDTKHAIIGVNIVSLGSLPLSLVHPREVFKPAILMNSSAIICAHNHPSGDPALSSEDRVLTTRLRQAGNLIGITALDHIILGDDRTYSFADQGWSA